MSQVAEPALTRSRTLHIYFCAWVVAGVRTQYENVRSVAGNVDDVAMHYVEINPYKPGGLIERAPLLGTRTRGTLRSLVCATPLYTAHPMDAVWTQADTALFPFAATRARAARIPYFISTDATTTQVESIAEYGMGATSRWQRAKHNVRDRLIGYCFTNATLVFPWSRWAATAIRAECGVPDERIEVVPPGVNLSAWRVLEPAQPTPSGRARLLFVGGDWERKGGPLLLDVFRTHLRGRCELHLVTKGAPADLCEPDIYVYADCGPNDPRLHRLYETCDALVLPTRADCFSLASIEAMASGLPVITCPVGGIPEIVEHGASGWLIPVGDGRALHEAIELLLADPDRARAMGTRGRLIVEDRFDAARNTCRVFELIRRCIDAQGR